MSIELPPLPGTALIFPNGKPERVMGADMVERAVEARERILLARIAELEATIDHDTAMIRDLSRIVDSQRARIAELEADAKRYRWLRDEAQYADDGLPYVVAWKRGRSVGEQEILAEEELDAAIDAARKGE